MIVIIEAYQTWEITIIDNKPRFTPICIIIMSNKGRKR